MFDLYSFDEIADLLTQQTGQLRATVRRVLARAISNEEIVPTLPTEVHVPGEPLEEVATKGRLRWLRGLMAPIMMNGSDPGHLHLHVVRFSREHVMAWLKKNKLPIPYAWRHGGASKKNTGVREAKVQQTKDKHDGWVTRCLALKQVTPPPEAAEIVETIRADRRLNPDGNKGSTILRVLRERHVL